MALVIDPSSPAAAESSAATTSTASFTPPDGTMLVAWGFGDASNGSVETLTVSSTGGLTWTMMARVNGGVGSTVEVWQAPCIVSPGSIVASVTDNQGAVPKRLFVQVFVDDDTPGGVGAVTTGSAISLSYASTVDGSWGWFSGLSGGALAVAGSGQTVKDSNSTFDGGDGTWVVSQNSLTVGVGTTVTNNVTFPTSAVHTLAVEILGSVSGIGIGRTAPFPKSHMMPMGQH